MQHYFIDKQHVETDFFDFNDQVLGLNLCFRSCDSIFSKNRIDDGSRTLLETVAKKCTLSGNCLDLGCGLGVIGISLAKKFNLNFDMIDINGTAVKISRQNTITNNVQRQTNVFESNGFSNISAMYDNIITNPPIKTGKTLLFSLMDGAYQHLNINGQLILVIRKDHGMESLKKHLIELFGNCEIIERNKGYYILKSIKNI